MPDGSAKLKSFFSNNLFLGSFENMVDIPKKKLPEICFIGRSNTGKSSIINAITKNKNLAKTSKTPGCTKSVNIFEINNKINIADLPGYGYAKTSKIIREKLTDMIESYLCSRLNITRTFVLIDYPKPGSNYGYYKGRYPKQVAKKVANFLSKKHNIGNNDQKFIVFTI